MKLSISTFKIICSCWNYPQEILDDKEMLLETIPYIDREGYLPYSKIELKRAKREIKQLIETL